MEPSGQFLGLQNDFIDQVCHSCCVDGFRQFLLLQFLLQRLAQKSNACQSLPEAIVQILTDPNLFLLTNPQQAPFQALALPDFCSQG